MPHQHRIALRYLLAILFSSGFVGLFFGTSVIALNQSQADPLSERPIWSTSSGGIAVTAPLLEADPQPRKPLWNFLLQSDVLVALDHHNKGEKKWEILLSSPFNSPPAIARLGDGATALFATSANGLLYKIDTLTGSPITWDTRRGQGAVCATDGLIAAPVVQSAGSNADFDRAMKAQDREADSLVFVITHNGCSDHNRNRVLAYYAHDLKLAWTFNGTGAYSMDYGSASCALDSINNILYCGTDTRPEATQETLWAIDTLDGTLLWKQDVGAVRTSPTLYKDNLYVANKDGELIAFTAATGDELWRITLTRSASIRYPFWVGTLLKSTKPSIIYQDSLGSLYRIDDQGQSAEKRWAAYLKLSSNILVLPEQDKIYVGTNKSEIGGLSEISLGSGQVRETVMPFNSALEPEPVLSLAFTATAEDPSAPRLLVTTAKRSALFGPSQDLAPSDLQITEDPDGLAVVHFLIQNNGDTDVASASYQLKTILRDGSQLKNSGTAYAVPGYGVTAIEDTSLTIHLADIKELAVEVDPKKNVPETDRKNNIIKTVITDDFSLEGIELKPKQARSSIVFITIKNQGTQERRIEWSVIITPLSGAPRTLRRTTLFIKPGVTTNASIFLPFHQSKIAKLEVMLDPNHKLNELSKNNNGRQLVVNSPPVPEIKDSPKPSPSDTFSCISLTTRTACKARAECGWRVDLSKVIDISTVDPEKGQCIANVPPGKPTLLTPLNDVTIRTLTPTFTWSDPGDADSTPFLLPDGAPKRAYSWTVIDLETKQKVWDHPLGSTDDSETEKECRNNLLNYWTCAYASVPVGKLEYSHTYLWTVKAHDSVSDSGFVNENKFFTQPGSSPASPPACPACEFFPTP